MGHVAQVQPVDAVALGGRSGTGGDPGNETVAALSGVEFGDDRAAVVGIARFASRNMDVGHDQQQVAGVVRGREVEVETLHALRGGINGGIKCGKHPVAGDLAARRHGNPYEIGR